METTWIFWPLKFHRKEYVETTWIFRRLKLHQKKGGNNADFSIIEITSKKVRGNNVDFSTIEITSKRIRGNDVNLSTIELTLKKFAEMTWKIIEIWSLTYRRNIHVESTWCVRWVCISEYFCHLCYLIKQTILPFWYIMCLFVVNVAISFCPKIQWIAYLFVHFFIWLFTFLK